MYLILKEEKKFLMKVIQDFWILTENGIVLFNRVFDEKVESQLFGALLSALSTFAEQVSEGGLSNFELSDKRFTLLRKKTLLFVANSSRKIKIKKVNSELGGVADKFINKYGALLKDWDNDTEPFSGFGKEVEDAFEDPVKAFWQAF